MKTFSVREVGAESLKDTLQAYNAMYALTSVLGCDWRVIGLPIWTNGRVSCFMPYSPTGPEDGRQYLVTEID